MRRGAGERLRRSRPRGPALALWAAAAWLSAGRARALDPHTVTAGEGLAGHAVVLDDGGLERTLCAPECTLSLEGGPLRIGLRRGDDGLVWTGTERLETDLRLDVVLEDRSLLRGLGHALLTTAGVLALAAGIVGLVSAPAAPDVGWFGPNHGLVFAGLASGLLVGFGIPGAALALGFAHDAPAVRAVPLGGLDL